MFESLNQPYPFTIETSRRIKQTVIVGFSIFTFFVIFKPFGLNNAPIAEVVKISAYYGVITIIIGLFNNLLPPVILPKYFNESSWTLRKNIQWGLWNLFSYTTGIGLSNYIISDHPQFTFEGYVTFMMYVFILGFSISTIISIVNQNYLLNKHYKIADLLNKNLSIESQSFPEDQVEFIINKFKKVCIPVHKLLYIEAVGNYINVVYENNGIKKIIIRETIGNIEQKTRPTGNLFRTHRSYLVNVHYIKEIIGDSQGLKIHMKEIENIIPVSRSRIKKFRELISNNN
ncbi:MAG: LytTR family DNA-binding domain-containing protein [Bacteroidota bacterium]